MHRVAHIAAVIGTAGTLLALTGASGSALASSSPVPHRSNFTTWHKVYRARLGVNNGLLSVTATGPRHAWAVGTNAVRWNGTNWRVMKPLPAGFSAFLVRASGPDNVWVFGNATDPGNPGCIACLTEVIRWNGTSWQMVNPQLPTAEGPYNQRVGDGDAVVISPTNVWYSDGSYLYHWDGLSWTGSPFSTPNNYTDLAATPNGRVWRVTSVKIAGHRVPKAQRWTGSRWQNVWVPHVHLKEPADISISIWSGRDIWIGMRKPSLKPRVLHWNGRRWTVMSPPSYAGPYDIVAAAGRHRVWIGDTALWNGRRWIMGIPVGAWNPLSGVPGTKAALLIGDRSRGSSTWGEIWQNGSLP